MFMLRGGAEAPWTIPSIIVVVKPRNTVSAAQPFSIKITPPH